MGTRNNEKIKESVTGPEAASVVEHPVDLNELGWSTLKRLGVGASNPGRDDLIELIARASLRHVGDLGNFYVNPKFTVRAKPGVPISVFVHAARRAQRAWLKELSQVLHSPRRMKRYMKAVTPLIRQLEFTGVMILNGKHLHPQQWPDAQGQRGG